MMDIAGIGSIFSLGETLIEKIWPDPKDQAREMRKLEELKQKGDIAELDAYVKLMTAQIKVNEEQAKHKSLFVSGGRPAAIWVGVTAMAWAGVIHPLLTWVVALAGLEVTVPTVVASEALIATTMGLLGVGGMRSFDKLKGNAKDSL